MLLRKKLTKAFINLVAISFQKPEKSHTENKNNPLKVYQLRNNKMKQLLKTQHRKLNLLGVYVIKTV